MYTRRWAAELLLDRIGYVADEDLTVDVLIEPCCGDGAFAVPIVERLLRSARQHGVPAASLRRSLVFVDIDPDAVDAAAEAVTGALLRAGVDYETTAMLTGSWFRVADFLLTCTLPGARWVVGNPPYLRIEDVPAARRDRYRRRWDAMRGRADVYVGFWQAGLATLAPGGRVGFICADRWLRNQYGTTLRRIVAQRHRVELVLDLHDVATFEQDVDAYPAMVVIGRGPSSEPARVGKLAAGFGADDLDALETALTRSATRRTETFSVWSQPQASFGPSGWVLVLPGDDGDVRHLQDLLPSLPDAGVRVHGGLATGADDVFIVHGSVDVETELLRRIVGPSDLVGGRLVWSGRRLIFPWTRSRALVDLHDHPRLAAYLAPYRARLERRHVVRTRKDRDGWWRTIDREPLGGYVGDALLIPDIRERVEPVLDTEQHVPMHSLYRLTSDVWDLEVLGGVLLSDFVHGQMKALSIAMASGRMRVSAQYLKRLRMPTVHQLGDVADPLREAFRRRDRESASELVRGVLTAVQASSEAGRDGC
ncbi:Eco57I restriction-modification methylase domain-containing protein [Curtobacterium sp. 20TX0008]|uniref:Eco57I restriction-modification methylase domain-containing protein n=1 Tax=Curtobacterium sp. 20TX0008 TaxID=3022018 RepID=UPI00232DC663|nr:Eco57I restriction-modification methylase domain-containing protein [Curtobacterium sp. 20TX0008]MDB6427095.1 Eco57I restriction-modification methylase domain-containing protein [Curtobacterium sp. 20TX0008]